LCPCACAQVVELLAKYRARTPQVAVATEEVQHRMAGRFVNEALLCLQGQAARRDRH
jgi:hypothetical protein